MWWAVAGLSLGWFAGIRWVCAGGCGLPSRVGDLGASSGFLCGSVRCGCTVAYGLPGQVWR